MRSSPLVQLWLFLFLLSSIGCSAKQADQANPSLPSSAQPASNEASETPVEPPQELIVVTNSRYLNWEKQSLGTTVSVREVSKFGNDKTESTTTIRLVKKTDNEIVVEQTSQIIAPDGTKYDPTTQALTYSKTVKLPKSQANRNLMAPSGIVETKEEEIEVLGKTYKAKFYLSKGRVEAGDTFTKTWIVPELPHAIVKTVHDIPASGKTVTSEIIKIESGKP